MGCAHAVLRQDQLVVGQCGIGHHTGFGIELGLLRHSQIELGHQTTRLGHLGTPIFGQGLRQRHAPKSAVVFGPCRAIRLGLIDVGDEAGQTAFGFEFGARWQQLAHASREILAIALIKRTD